ncbi:MAG: serine/threonine protein kinase [Sandaracinaceae bacterium]
MSGDSAAPDLSVEDPRIGEVVQDKYRIVRRLGEGGMGVVYEGEHLMIKRRVAIKMLHTQFAADPTVVKRFHNEAIAATSIGHPHIIECTDMGRLSDGTFFMVLEFLNGRDFDDLIEKEGPQPLGRVVHILLQACDALQAAHDKGIIHRDLKPENLYLIERSEDPYFVKVLDFGIAKFMEGKDESMTQTGQTIGTPHFMSPEQLQGSKDLDPRADLYALGVILYHALSGRFPFEAETFPLLIMSIFNHQPMPLTTFRADLPPELIHVIDRLLAKNPAHRYGSARELKQALLPFREVYQDPQMLSQSAAPVVPGSGPQPITGPMGGGSYPNGAPIPGTAPHMAGAPGSSPGFAPPGSSPGYLPPGSSPGYVHPGTMAPAPAASKLPLLVAFGSLLVAAAVVGALVFGMNQQQETPTPDTANESEEENAQVPVHIAVVPLTARLYLDGDPISNPFVTQLPASRETRRLEARLDGYETRSEMVSLRYPLNVNWELEETPADPEPVQPETVVENAPPTPSGRRGGRRGSRPTGTETAATETVTTPPVERVTPPPVERPPPTPVEPPPGAGLKRVRF